MKDSERVYEDKREKELNNRNSMKMVEREQENVSRKEERIKQTNQE